MLPIGTDPSPDATRLTSAAETETAAATTEPAVVAPAAQVPVEFTACSEGYDEARVTGGHEETVTIPVTGGEMTVNRGRGHIVPQIMSGVSDPRLDGTWSLAWNEDDYIGGQGAPSPNIVTIILRIENDEGAWQGTDTALRFPGVADFGALFHVMMTGEGAYEGLTAAMAFGGDVGVGSEAEPCPNVRGYILDGGVPEAEGTFPAR